MSLCIRGLSFYFLEQKRLFAYIYSTTKYYCTLYQNWTFCPKNEEKMLFCATGQSTWPIFWWYYWYSAIYIKITIWTLNFSNKTQKTHVFCTVCSIVHSESKKTFWLKQDPNLGQLELPQVDAKTTEPMSYLRNLLVL